MNRKFEKSSLMKSFINKVCSVQPYFSTKHLARVKPSQYIAELTTAAVAAAAAAVIHLTRTSTKA